MRNLSLRVLGMVTTISLLMVQGVCAQAEGPRVLQLRADYEALLSAREEYAQIEGAMGPAELADYGSWIQQLGDQFAATCRAMPTQDIPADIPCTRLVEDHPTAVVIDLQSESTDDEKVATMVDQFNASLGEFDEKLLREQDRVKDRRPQIASASSSGGGAAGGADGGADSSAEGGAEGEGAAEEGYAGGAEESQGSDQQGNEQVAGGSRGRPSAGQAANIPDDIPDGRDDDVIARQLREAAEKETDPELQKKLWEEYKRYKSGQ